MIEKFFRGVDSLHDCSRFLLFLVSFSKFTKIIFSKFFVTANILIQFVETTKNNTKIIIVIANNLLDTLIRKIYS